MKSKAVGLANRIFWRLGLAGILLGVTMATTAAEAPAAHAPAARRAVPVTVKLPPLPKNAERFDHGRFEGLVAYRPDGDPKQVVLFLSGDEGAGRGWNARAEDFAQTLATAGALVIGIDTHKLLAVLEADDAECEFLDGDLENLSHFVQAYFHLANYQPPIIAGYAEGATLAYAMMVQAPDKTFGGALSLAFSPQLALKKPLCKGSGITTTPSPDGRGVVYEPAARLGAPWAVLQGEMDRVAPLEPVLKFIKSVGDVQLTRLPQLGHSFSIASEWRTPLLDTYARLVAKLNAPPVAAAPTDLAGLPVIEVAVKPGVPPADSFALLLSGDGGWAGLDQEVAGALADQGIPVVGLDSLRYFWSPRTPEGIAKDLDRIIRYYLPKLDKKRVLLIGYSQGADVLPFALNRLPQATRAQIAVSVLMGLSEHALFEFHLSSWVGTTAKGMPTLPEVARIEGVKLLCIYGEGEDDSLCPRLDATKVKVVKLPGGHHFDGDYGKLAGEILSAAQ